MLLGTVLYALFIPAMSNMQGNSITGVPSTIGFLLIYMVMNITLISALFNMSSMIPDQVLGWVGNMANSHRSQEEYDWPLEEEKQRQQRRFALCADVIGWVLLLGAIVLSSYMGW